jgi:hypothetical protein
MPPFRDPSPVYGMDPETAARLVEAYRRARFSGTEEGRREAARILEEIRSGKYLPPIDWGQPEPEPAETIQQPSIIAEPGDEPGPRIEVQLRPPTAPEPGPTPRPVIYSDPRRTALLQEIRTRTGAQRVRESQRQRSRTTRPSQPRTERPTRGGKEIVTPPPGAARTRTELERREAVQQVRFIPPQIGLRPPSYLSPDLIVELLPYPPKTGILRKR